jgi:hypothetical protein
VMVARGLDKDLHATAQTQEQGGVDSLLDVVVR